MVQGGGEVKEMTLCRNVVVADEGVFWISV